MQRCVRSIFLDADMSDEPSEVTYDDMNANRVVIEHQNVVGENFGGQRISQFVSIESRFDSCTFDGIEIASASFGAGRGMSEYVGCSFMDARIHMNAGGFARFIDCSFEKVQIDHWFCFAVELIGCTFSGRLSKAIFNGSVPADNHGMAGRVVNRFEGNDFSRADLVDVSFRTGIDLDKQRLPSGDGYVRLADAVDAMRRARVAYESWESVEDKAAARGVLHVLEQDVAAGQRQLLVRVDDYPPSTRHAVRALLNAAQPSDEV